MCSKMGDQQDYSQLIAKIVLYIGVAIVVILLLWGIFGNSPTIEQILLGLVIMIFGYLLTINSKITQIGETLQ